MMDMTKSKMATGFELDRRFELPPPHTRPAPFATLDIQRVVPPKGPPKPGACRPVEELAEAVYLIVKMAAGEPLEFTFESRQPWRLCGEQDVAGFHRRAGCCQTNSNQSQFTTKCRNLPALLHKSREGFIL